MSKLIELLTKRVREAMAPRGVPAEICRKTGLSRTQVQRWLKEPVNPTIETLDKIAHALGTEPWELLRPPDAPPLLTAAEPTHPEHDIRECIRRVRELEERGLQADAEKRGKADHSGPGARDKPGEEKE